MTEPDQKSPLSHWKLLLGWTVLIIFVVMTGLFLWQLRDSRHHAEVRERMGTAIVRLALDRPSDLTEIQWAYCIAWTWQLHANYGGYFHVPAQDQDRIAKELEQRIQRGANLDDIDWIWDQYFLAYPPAVRGYAQFRPTSETALAEAETDPYRAECLVNVQELCKQKFGQPMR